jgi:hypothetical protein
LIKQIIIVFLFLLLSTAAYAETVTFAWDAYSESASITGFHLFQSKQSGIYGATQVATFSPTATTGSIAKPTQYGRFYWVLTAFYLDASVTPNLTTESDYSNEVNMVIKPKAPTLKSVTLTALGYIAKPATYLAGLFGRKNLKITELS